MPRLKFAMVCASNNNRSMEAHALLSQHNMQVASFGVGNNVKLPGPSQKQPNVYKFGTPYQDIYNDLLKQNRDLYVKNGLLPMLERNMSVKQAPEKWQDNRTIFDVAFTFEERVMEQLVEDMNRRSQGTMKILLVVNMVCHCQAGFVSCSVGSLDTLHDRLMGSLMAVMAQPQ
ncbi:hypothetical protein ABBQ38_013877 [Trebouxia sp. C0009 RCD-2024]